MNQHIILVAFLAAPFLMVFGCSEDEMETLSLQYSWIYDFIKVYKPNFSMDRAVLMTLSWRSCSRQLDLRSDVSYSQLVGVKSAGSELNRVELGLRGKLPVP